MTSHYPIGATAGLSPSPAGLRILLLGTCAVSPIVDAAATSGQTADHLLYESYSFSPKQSANIENYDVCVVSLTLRHIFQEASGAFTNNFNGDDLLLLKLNSDESLEKYLELCKHFLKIQFDKIALNGSAVPTFFLSFLEPRENLTGLLAPIFKLTNPAYFIRKMNEYLCNLLTEKPGFHMLDVNALANAFGRRRIQDDYTLHIAHASYISDFDVSYDTNRLQKSIAPSAMYQSAEAIKEFGQHLIERLAESIKVIRQSHPIKLIIVDLDDTLWRGVAADDDRPDWEFTEGWPLGLVEALLIFKRRGGLLAICSKNDHDGTAARFEKIWKGRISLSDFASVKINFDRKSANIEEILNEVNILAESTLFIDDNPREIEEVREAFSQLRTLSAQHYDWRRVILTSAETQSFLNTTESQNRTELIKAKIQRDSARKGLSTGDWLASLEIKQRHKLISDQNDSDFERAFELLNKTNQFNTTGRRWTRDEIVTRMAGGAYFVASFLRDRLVDNGLVGLSLVDGNEILQAVLSCRVFNMEAEYSSGHVVCNLILENHDTVVGRFAETGKNFTCREYFKNMGFEKNGDIFVTAKLPPHPTHIESTIG